MNGRRKTNIVYFPFGLVPITCLTPLGQNAVAENEPVVFPFWLKSYSADTAGKNSHHRLSDDLTGRVLVGERKAVLPNFNGLPVIIDDCAPDSGRVSDGTCHFRFSHSEIDLLQAGNGVGAPQKNECEKNG